MAGRTDGASAVDFDALYDRARDRLAVQIAALTGDASEAVDHVQEAFVRAWLRWAYVSGLEDPEGWVRRVAYNLAVSRFRSARRMVLRNQVPDGRIEWDDEQRELVAALRELPTRHREAVVLHHLVDLSLAEVAEWLGAPTGTVKSWLHRGRRELAVALGRTTTQEELTR